MKNSSTSRVLGWLSAIMIVAGLSASPAMAQGESGGGNGSGGTGSGSGAAFVPQSGFWQDANSSTGVGVVMEVNAQGEIFGSTLLYTDWGRAVWYVVNTQGGIDAQSGQLQQFSGGQGLEEPWRQAQFIGFAGEVSFRFTSPTTGTMTWPGGIVNIKRYDIVAGGVASGPMAGAPRGGWWFNSEESGRGVFLEAQGDNLYVTALMYDGYGQATWYTARGPMISANTFTGQLFEAHGGQTMNGGAQAPAGAYSYGNITLQFLSDHQAQLTTPNGKVIELVRYTF